MPDAAPAPAQPAGDGATEAPLEEQPAETGDPELTRRITEAFEVFDHDANKSVDVREVGTIIRSLGCCPTEAEIAEFLSLLDEEATPGYVQLDKFLPVMTQALIEQKYTCASEEYLKKAFQMLDTENKTFLTEVELKKVMMEEGEPFTQEEIEEMLAVAINTEDNACNYKLYIPTLLNSNN